MPWPVRAGWRYLVTGQSVRGPAHDDNATLFHDATEDHRGRPYTRLTRARWRRLARRHAAITMPAACLAASPVYGDAPLVTYASALGIGTLTYGTYAARRHWTVGKARREWVYPAAQVACRVLGVPYRRRDAARMIDLPSNWGAGADTDEGRAAVRVHIPAGVPLGKRLKDTLVEQVGARLGIPDPRGEWREAGESVTVDIQATPTPPKTITLAQVLKHIAAAADHEIVVGIAPGGKPVTVSTAEDSPHFALSGSSGTGKSVTLKLMLAQRMERGDGVIFLDPKRWSHWRWAGGGKLPGTTARYAYRTEDIHAAWLEIAAEMERRIELSEDELALLRRVWICVEEINTQTRRLARWWKGERKRIANAAKAVLADAVERCDGNLADGLALAIAEGLDEADLDPPLTSPAIVAMQESVGMGRELKMHVVVAAQRLSASVFGGNGGDIRESFQGGRFIAKWDRKLWKMLVDTLAYVACPNGPRGIWGVARGEEFVIFRVPNMSDGEATAMALRCPATGPILGAAPVGHGIGPADVSAVGHDVRLAITAGVTLSEAVGQLPAGKDGQPMTLDALRRASTRKGFPAALAKPDGAEYGQHEARRYDLATLVDWRAEILGLANSE